MIRDRCQVIYENWMKKNSNLYLYYCFVRAICQKKEKKKKKKKLLDLKYIPPNSLY
jgi:hypothetical protein